jgi:hypothetical protein
MELGSLDELSDLNQYKIDQMTERIEQGLFTMPLSDTSTEDLQTLILLNQQTLDIVLFELTHSPDIILITLYGFNTYHGILKGRLVALCYENLLTQKELKKRNPSTNSCPV